MQANKYTTSSNDLTSDIELHIPSDIYAKVIYWIDKAQGEVSGLGKIQVTESAIGKTIFIFFIILNLLS